MRTVFAESESRGVGAVAVDVGTVRVVLDGAETVDLQMLPPAPTLAQIRAAVPDATPGVVVLLVGRHRAYDVEVVESSDLRDVRMVDDVRAAVIEATRHLAELEDTRGEPWLQIAFACTWRLAPTALLVRAWGELQT